MTRNGRPDIIRDMSNPSTDPITIKITADQRRVIETFADNIPGVEVRKTVVNFKRWNSVTGESRTQVEALRSFLVSAAAAKTSKARTEGGKNTVAESSVLRKAHRALDEWEAENGDSLAVVEAVETPEAPEQVIDGDDIDGQAFEMRAGGAPFRVIAEALGFAAPASARAAAIRGAAKVGQPMPEARKPVKVVPAKTATPTEPAVEVEAEVFVPADIEGIERGQEVTISTRGEASPGGRFRFDRFSGDGSLTCWGPVNDQRASWRNFRSDRVKQVHRKVKDVAAAKAMELAS